MSALDFLNILNEDMEIVIYIIKMVFLSICTQYTIFKSSGKALNSKIGFITFIIFLVICSIIASSLKYKLDYLSSILLLILWIGILNGIYYKKEIISSITNVIICLGINYVIFFISMIIDFIFNIIVSLQSDYTNIILMMIIHVAILFRLFKIKRFNKGIDFIKENANNNYFNMLILNISITVVVLFIILKNSSDSMTSKVIIVIGILVISMFVTTKAIITMYYKHKLLVSDLEATKSELEDKKKEIEKLEAENLEFSKTSHTISHQLKSLKFKIKELEMSKELSSEIDISNRVQEISEKYCKKVVVVNIDKTDIVEIDDMLNYMQSECINYGIEFELQLNGNIHYMVNNIIQKEDLEILLADHIKDAIIAINHSDNINKNILVRLGVIDGVYSIYIYDSGIEFEKETLAKLGKEPITTHKNEGGTGMGFMNTFDKLKKYNASMIINEIGKPNKDNYTKAIIIKFDKKNNFVIKSYREITIAQ